MYHKTLSYYSTIFYRSFAAFTGEQLQAVGLNFGLLFFVIYVGKHPGCSLSELTKALYLDWGYSQRSLNKLAADGFLSKEKHGRSYTLTLTDRGQQAFVVSHQVFFTWDDTRLANLNDTEKDQLLAFYKKQQKGCPNMYETIFSPVNYGGLELKNRIIFAPTTFGLSDEEYFAKIRAIAAGGCAMIIVGDVPEGKSRFEKSLFDKTGFAWYQSLAEIIHSCGCKLCAQLHQSDSNMAAMLKYVPGVLTKKITMQQLRTLLNEEVAPYITNLPQRKIDKIIHGFGEAAELAVKAGFDMVQIHGDRMCGSFSSSVFNHRTDAYGGSAENRARFAVEAVRAVRSRLPELLHRLQTGCPAARTPTTAMPGTGKRTGYLCTAAGGGRCDQLPRYPANHSSLEDTILPANHPYC